MARNTESGRQFVLQTQAVRKAIGMLAARRSHNHVPGYLALLRCRLENDPFSMGLNAIEQFHGEYLRVPGAPHQKPYLQLFRSRGTGASLLNRNLQGSYAPSSIRQGQPLSHVIKVTANYAPMAGNQGYTYELVEDHANKVLSEMLAGHRLLAVSLAIFLFRDHVISLPANEIEGLVLVLRDFLRIRPNDTEGDYIFETLFENDSASFSNSDLEEV